MSQSQESKADAAEQRSEETRSFVRRVKAATRRRYTPEGKIRVVLEGFRREVTVMEPAIPNMVTAMVTVVLTGGWASVT